MDRLWRAEDPSCHRTSRSWWNTLQRQWWSLRRAGEVSKDAFMDTHQKMEQANLNKGNKQANNKLRCWIGSLRGAERSCPQRPEERALLWGLWDLGHGLGNLMTRSKLKPHSGVVLSHRQLTAPHLRLSRLLTWNAQAKGNSMETMNKEISRILRFRAYRYNMRISKDTIWKTSTPLETVRTERAIKNPV